MKQKFSFLCGNADNIKYIFGVKFGAHPWHYFEEIDSILSEHGSLPSELDDLVGSLKQNRSIDVELNEDQAQNYFKNEKFVFKNIELKTRTSSFSYKFDISLDHECIDLSQEYRSPLETNCPSGKVGVMTHHG